MPEPQNGKGSINKLGVLNKALGVGFVGVDSYVRMKDGEAAPVAVGKALLTNAAWAMAPGGVVGGLAIGAGIGALQVVPAVTNHINQKKATHNQNLNRFGSNFQSSQAQMAMQYQGMNQIQSAMNHNSARMMSHASGAVKRY